MNECCRSDTKSKSVEGQQLTSAPENCTLWSRTKHSVVVRCATPEHWTDVDDGSSSSVAPIYMLQAYEARSRLLLGTATSRTPEELRVDDLPSGVEFLLLVRTMTRAATSDAAVLYTGEPDATSHHRRAGTVGGKPPTRRIRILQRHHVQHPLFTLFFIFLYHPSNPL